MLSEDREFQTAFSVYTLIKHWHRQDNRTAARYWFSGRKPVADFLNLQHEIGPYMADYTFMELRKGGHFVVWNVLNMIGTVAFAISGAIVAIEEDYDLLGVYILGFATAFGGGITRNLLIDLPLELVWQQEKLFYIAAIAVAIVFFLPNYWFERWQRWFVFFDAIGLAAFAIQGAMYAKEMEHPLITVVFAAAVTGTGGGVIRDVLARRQPLIFRKNLYAVWAMLGGFIVGLGLAESEVMLYSVVALIVLLRMLSYRFNWHLPRRGKNRKKSI